MKRFKPLILSFCLLALASCNQTWNNFKADIGELEMPSLSDPMTDERSEQLLMGGNCPGVEVVEELSAFSEFTDMAAPSQANLVSSSVLGQIESKCEYAGKSVTMDLKIAFNGMLGPQGRAAAGEQPSFSYPFFIAVTDPGGDILAKEVFATSVSYAPGQESQVYHEDLRQIIPVPDQEHGARYKVLVGFQLSQDQLQFNRAVIAQRKAEAEAAAKALANAPAQPVEPVVAVPPGAVQEKAVTVVPPPEKIDGQPLDITR